jgi:hypothetical protein
LNTNLNDDTVWLNPPFNEIDQYLDHYLACKARAPTTLLACILLPDWTESWNRKVEHMRVVKKFPKGELVV